MGEKLSVILSAAKDLCVRRTDPSLRSGVTGILSKGLAELPKVCSIGAFYVTIASILTNAFYK